MGTYRVCGLVVASETALPGLIEIAQVPADAAPDVTIRHGPVPADLEDATASGPTWRLAGSRFLLSIPGIARFLIEDGRRITTAPEAGVSLSDVTIFLVGTAIGILLHQRGQIVLHASAVRVGGKAALFCGQSGAGKSTLAAALTRHGYPLVTDDICALTFDAQGHPIAMPDGRQLKLWAQAIEALELSDGRRDAVRSVLEKFYVEPMAALADSLPLGPVYGLREARAPLVEGIARPNVVDAALLFRRSAYRPLLIERMDQKTHYFEAAARIADTAGIFQLSRTLDFARMSEVIAWLEGHWADMGLVREAA